MKIKFIKKIAVTGFFLLFFLFILLSPFYMLKGAIDYCEDNDWDGSKYTFSMKDLSIKNFGEEWGIVCTKEKDTDTIIKLVNSFLFWE